LPGYEQSKLPDWYFRTKERILEKKKKEKEEEEKERFKKPIPVEKHKRTSVYGRKFPVSFFRRNKPR